MGLGGSLVTPSASRLKGKSKLIISRRSSVEINEMKQLLFMAGGFFSCLANAGFAWQNNARIRCPRIRRRRGWRDAGYSRDQRGDRGVLAGGRRAGHFSTRSL